MIPSGTLAEQDFEEQEQPDRTYRIDSENGRISGSADSIEAVKQAVYKILSTERYQYIMYSWDYGIELNDLYGEPVSYVCPELERRITEALTWDERIESVDGFEFDLSRKNAVAVKFTVHTIYGSIETGKEVEI